ncbi:MAG: S49 family peptidase [Verrucomicrobiota bacterium]
MKQLPQISSLLYGQAWAILPAVHAEFGALYRNYLAGTLTAPVAIAEKGEACYGISYQANHSQGIAIVSMSGVIMKRAPNMLCGPPVIDLSALDGLLDEIAADSLIETAVFDINSPGGMMIGIAETCERMRELSAQGIRTIAYADYQMCSAGYYLACACDEIYCAPSAAIGSIGVYCAGLDDSRAWEMEGLELVLAKSGNLKAMGHPGKAWSPDERAWLQGMAENCGTQFRDWVTDRRGDVPEEAMQGQWYPAKEAAPALHDGLYRDLPALLADIMQPA